MTTPRDPDQLIRAFLAEGRTDLADRTYDAVRADIDRTRQRIVIGPLREPRSNGIARFAAAVAAVLVVAVVGINLLPGNGGVGGPAADPTPSPSAAVATPSPTPVAFAFPPAGGLAIGSRQTVTTAGVRYSFAVPTSGWTSEGHSSISKGTEGTTGSSWMLFWDPANVYADPCAQVPLSPPTGPAAADLAKAIAAEHGRYLTGPLDVTVGGRAAKTLVLTLPDTLGCVPKDFYLWYGESEGDQCLGTNACGRYATAPGDTIRVWVVDVDGARVFIEAETRKDAGPELQREIQQIVDSIRFE